MLLHNLPEDIQDIVLKKCVGAGNNTADGLRGNLPLLAVCRLWRRLAIPVVYNRVFIQYGEPPKRTASWFVHNLDAEEPANVAVKTNLDLVAMVGCARAVKRVEIGVHFVKTPLLGWREVIQRMRTVANKWRVVELVVAMSSDRFRFNSRNVDLAQYTDAIAEVSDAFAALMPCVRCLVCEGSDYNPVAWPLSGHLAGHYADQLWRIDSRHPITAPQGCQLTRLKSVSINYDGVADYQPPQMATGELVDLSLVNPTPHHSWASFSTDSELRVIEFTKLKRLHAVYHTTRWIPDIEERPRNEAPWKLHFPSLESLVISSTNEICPLLEYAELPPHMGSISIIMTSPTYENHANLVLPTAKCLSLIVSSGSRGDSSGLFAVNRILQSARGSERLELSIEDSLLRVRPESITCTALTHLQILSPISVDSMLALFERLPRLAKLSLLDLDPSDIQADMSVPDADGDIAVETLHSSLVSLHLDYDIGSHSPDAAVAVVKHVLLRIPTLAELAALQVPRSPVLKFVKTYAPRYPHLGGVELKLDEDGDAARTRWSF